MQTTQMNQEETRPSDVKGPGDPGEFKSGYQRFIGELPIVLKKN